MIPSPQGPSPYLCAGFLGGFWSTTKQSRKIQTMNRNMLHWMQYSWAYMSWLTHATFAAHQKPRAMNKFWRLSVFSETMELVTSPNRRRFYSGTSRSTCGSRFGRIRIKLVNVRLVSGIIGGFRVTHGEVGHGTAWWWLTNWNGVENIMHEWEEQGWIYRWGTGGCASPSGVRHPFEENSGISYLSCKYYLLYWNDWFSNTRENIEGTNYNFIRGWRTEAKSRTGSKCVFPIVFYT